MKRQIPVFKVNVQPGASYDQLHEIPEVKEVVIEEVIYAIKDAIKRKKSKISFLWIIQNHVSIQKNELL